MVDAIRHSAVFSDASKSARVPCHTGQNQTRARRARSLLTGQHAPIASIFVCFSLNLINLKGRGISRNGAHAQVLSSHTSSHQLINEATPVTTAAISPDKFADGFLFSTRPITPRIVAVLLALVIAIGFGLRVYDLSAEGLSEDELNKLQAVAEYRERGLSPSNGEHPMLMKALMTTSIVLSEKWNDIAINAKVDLSRSPDIAKQESARHTGEATTAASDAAQATQQTTARRLKNNSSFFIAPETALRLPATIFGALTALLIFFLTRELFGTPAALLAAALWSLDPTAIGFNRIAKEDTFFNFFFLLASVFWLRAQTRAERDNKPFDYLLWLTAVSLGAMVAAKYYPHFIPICAAYYFAFIGIPSTRFHVGKTRWIIFIFVMGGAFIICNLTILLPGTWSEMLAFATEKRIGHDSTEFLGALYPNQMSYWLRGVPVTFYYVFLLTKTTLPMLFAFFVGLTQIFRRRIGDGRFFLFFWFVIGFLPFTFLGGKFTRYYTLALPLVHIVSAIGLLWLGHTLARFLSRRFATSKLNATYAHDFFITIALLSALLASINAAPYYRLYNNTLGGGMKQAGDFFPHDDFYDASMRDTAQIIARDAAPNARVAGESLRLFLHYAALAGRTDLQAISLSDESARAAMQTGDYVILARGRRYRSNERIVRELPQASRPAFTLNLGEVPSVQIFKLDAASLQILRN